ncbi:DUF2946 family protein [Azospirillum thiophilum]|nr:DUF2946 family protein [Azospirillum thiophilum]
MILDRNGRRRAWRIGGLAGAVALLLQIVSWAWMPAVIQAANAADTSRIVICAPDGFKTVLLDDRGMPVDPDAADSGAPEHAMSGGSCPLCPLIGGLAMPPLAVFAMSVDFERHGPEQLPGSRIAAGWFLSTLQARAPPVTG